MLSRSRSGFLPHVAPTGTPTIPSARCCRDVNGRHVRRVTSVGCLTVVAVRNLDERCPAADRRWPRSAPAGAAPLIRSVVLALQLSVPGTATPGTRQLKWVKTHHTYVAFAPPLPLQARTFIPR